MNQEQHRYHYTECGLDNIYLINGFEEVSTSQGPTISIRDIDSLHQAIGEIFCGQSRDLGGKEIRFLRREMLMSQRTLAQLFDVQDRTVSRWEADKTVMSKSADTLLRLLYREQVKLPNGGIKECLLRIADLEEKIDCTYKRLFELQIDEGEEVQNWAQAA
jgi:DNA-binding transcriptional regulator YiaG